MILHCSRGLPFSCGSSCCPPSWCCFGFIFGFGVFAILFLFSFFVSICCLLCGGRLFHRHVLLLSFGSLFHRRVLLLSFGRLFLGLVILFCSFFVSICYLLNASSRLFHRRVLLLSFGRLFLGLVILFCSAGCCFNFGFGIFAVNFLCSFFISICCLLDDSSRLFHGRDLLLGFGRLFLRLVVLFCSSGCFRNAVWSIMN
mmetsp:Transcript_14610/g.29944  ORF Transcript_14610/g.29944 Transcript_14610/m.29944 type:complete len:200 (-) Transcript_14610:35-634(-)